MRMACSTFCIGTASQMAKGKSQYLMIPFHVMFYKKQHLSIKICMYVHVVTVATMYTEQWQNVAVLPILQISYAK